MHHEHSVEGDALPAVHVRVERSGERLIPIALRRRPRIS